MGSSIIDIYVCMYGLIPMSSNRSQMIIHSIMCVHVKCTSPVLLVMLPTLYVRKVVWAPVHMVLGTSAWLLCKAKLVWLLGGAYVVDRRSLF